MKELVNRICLECSKPFQTPAWRVRQGKGKYCSPRCARIAIARHQIGGHIHSAADRAARRERITGEKNPMFGHFREANPNWKGGRTIDNRFGYILILTPSHPRAHKGDPGGYIYEHVLVAEKKLGRFLNLKERVHHIDGNPQNNSPKNLLVLSGDKEHAEIHNKRRKRNELGQYS
jgi:hypothetical protein